jgi:hypothetical protein
MAVTVQPVAQTCPSVPCSTQEPMPTMRPHWYQPGSAKAECKPRKASVLHTRILGEHKANINSFLPLRSFVIQDSAENETGWRYRAAPQRMSSLLSVPEIPVQVFRSFLSLRFSSGSSMLDHPPVTGTCAAFSIRLPMLQLSIKNASSRSSTIVSFRASATTKPSGQLRIASVS